MIIIDQIKYISNLITNDFCFIRKKHKINFLYYLRFMVKIQLFKTSLQKLLSLK